jgi:hypothetical protein
VHVCGECGLSTRASKHRRQGMQPMIGRAEFAVVVAQRGIAKKVGCDCLTS